MKATFLLLAVLSGGGLSAQVPPQFSTLLQDSSDYTCGGSPLCATWPMPPIPAPGGSYVDPTWGTTTYRLAVPPANTAGQAVSTYSRVQAWNSDNSRMFLTELATSGGGFLDLYDSTTTPPTPINRINTDVAFGVNAISNDALWSFTDPNRLYFVPWRNSGHGLELRYVDVSACTKESCTLTSHIVHTFSCTADANTGDIPAGTLGDKIETGSGGQGGMFDKTDRYFSFTCDKVDGSGRHEIDFIRYDRTTDTVTTQMPWYNVCPGQVPTGCAVWSKTGLRHNLFRMNQHPDSRFITVIWQCGARDATWTRGCGTEVYDPSYNYIGVASPYDGHQDVGFDVNGVPVLVGVGSGRLDIKDDRSIAITNLTTISPTAQIYKRIILPCSYSRQPTCTGIYLGAKAGASHISMTGTWGSTPGYGLLSTMIMAGTSLNAAPNYAPTCLACGDTGFAAMENLAVKIDTTAADGSDAQFYRIGRTMAIRDNTYNAEPHTAVNRDFTQITWGSTWNQDPTSSAFPVYGFWTRLSSPSTQGKVACIKPTGQQGVCTSGIDASGNCTCN